MRGCKQGARHGAGRVCRKREGELLGSLGVLFAPELEKGIGIEAADEPEPVHPGMAGAAERDQPGEARAPGAAVMDDQRRRSRTRGRADPAQLAVAGDHRRAQAGIEAPVMLFAGVAGGTEPALCYLKRPAAAPQGGLPAAKDPRGALVFPAGWFRFAPGSAQDVHVSDANTAGPR